MKASMVSIISWTLLVLGCSALAFACLLAWVEWGGGAPGGWFSDVEFPGVAREVGIAMAISVVIGLAGVAFGLRMRRVKGAINAGPTKD